MLLGRARALLQRGGLLLAALAAIASVAACGSTVAVTPLCTKPGQAAQPDPFDVNVSLLTLKYGLRYGDITVGCGPQVRSGQPVATQYTGWLQNGSQFDSSRNPGRQPLVFVLGQQQVIPGFDIGVTGMRVGGERRIVIPPSLGYGDQGVPPVIPANATLILDVELIATSR